MMGGFPSLVPLEKLATQAYFSNRVQLADVIERVLDYIGPASVRVSTFSTSEEFLRRLARLRGSGRVLRCSLFCDLRAARKTAALYGFIRSVFSEVRLCENHSKVVLLRNDTRRVAVVTSQNQTRGNRFEAGIITSDPGVYAALDAGLDLLAANSLSLDDLVDRHENN